MPTVLEAIAIANPPTSKSQSEAAAFVKQMQGIPESVLCRIDQIYASSAIDRRYTCIADYDRPTSKFEFYPRTPSLLPPPGTARRNEMYRKWAPEIAEQAARKALLSASRSPSAITHVIAVTCTGFFSPGLDVHLIKSLGLNKSTQRTVIGFMGCCAAFNALRTANAICVADGLAVVLIVCVELCTLHFQPIESLEDAVISSIFADGAAAAILSANPPRRTEPALAISGSMSLLDENSLEDMTWTIGNTGFLMGLSPRVPTRLGAIVSEYVDSLLESSGSSRSQVDAWAIHPGGRKVLDIAAESLDLAPAALDDSYAVLRDYGNMSSPTIFFIMARLLDRHRISPMRSIVAIGFGPGLTIEGCVLTAAEGFVGC